MSSRFLLVNLCLLLALVLSACSAAAPAPAPAAQPATQTPAAEPTKEPATAEPQPTTAPEPTTAPSAAELSPVELTYVYVGGLPKDQQVVNDAVNVYLKDKINATVKLQMLDWGAYTDKVNLMFASGEDCDILFTAPWMAPSTAQLVSNGSLMPLDDLLPANAPDLMKAMPADGWSATKIKGQTYGVPFQEIWVKPFGVAVRKDLADKYALDVTKVEKFEDLEPFMDAVLEGEEGVTPIALWDSTPGSIYMAETFGFDPIVTQDVQVVVRYDDKDLKAINAFESPEFKSAVELAHKWYQAGYFPKDLIPAADFDAQFKAGKYAMGLATIAKPGGEAEFASRRGYDVYMKSLTTPFKATGSVAASQTAICAQSKNPERAAMFINLLQTDPQLYNLLAYGIEGKHWVWDDKEQNLIKAGPEKDAYNPSSNWLFGNTMLGYYSDPIAAKNKTLEATAALNNSAAPSVALGFTFDPEPVKNEMAQVGAAVKELGWPLINGQADPVTALPEFIAKLKDAGMDKIVAEAQTQLDAWAKTK